MSHAYIATFAALDAHKSDIYSVVVCEKYTITGSGDGEIKLWDNSQPEPTSGTVILSGSQGIHHMAVDFSGKHLAAVGFDARLQLFDLQTCKPCSENVQSILDQNQDAWGVAFARDVPYLAVSTIDGVARLYNMETFELIQTFSTNRKGFGVSVDVSPGGGMVAVGFEKGGLYLYSTETGRLSYSLSSHSSAIRAVAFSPAGNFLAASGDSAIIALYDTTSGEHVANLPGHESWVFSLAWNETGEYLLSTSYDGKCKIWAMESRSCVASQSESNAPLFSGAWFRKEWGKNVVGGYSQGVVAVGAEMAVRWYREASGQ